MSIQSNYTIGTIPSGTLTGELAQEWDRLYNIYNAAYKTSYRTKAPADLAISNAVWSEFFAFCKANDIRVINPDYMY